MTNLSSQDIEEFEYTEETGLEPGFFYRLNGNQSVSYEWEEYRDLSHRLHRWTGPAIIAINYSNHPNEWYIHGKKIECKTQEEFIKIRERLLKLKVFW